MQYYRPHTKDSYTKLVLLLLTLLITTLSINVCAADVPTLQRITQQSSTLGVTKSFYVLLPDDYVPTKRYPTIYVLHGASGNYQDWVVRSSIQKISRKYQAILIFPDGNPYSWYVDSPSDTASQYESYIIKELIPYVDSNFATINESKGRAITGLSMGGHGAITLAFKHPDMFASASALSGILDITKHPTQWQIALRLGPYTTNQKLWEDNSALFLAVSVPTDTHLQLFVDCGISDTYAITDNRAFHNKLNERGIPHRYVERPGVHNWDYWNGNIDEHLAFHIAALASVVVNQ